MQIGISKEELIDDRQQLLESAQNQSNTDPFYFGDEYDSGDDLVPFAFGLWLEASFNDEMTQNTTVKGKIYLFYIFLVPRIGK